MNFLLNVKDALVDWLAHGLIDTTWWQLVLIALVLTHITIASVTIFLHRSQAHRSLDLHPIPAHFFRFWLWIATGQVTKEWVAVHRKHHAKCETAEDPHSPYAHGIKKVLLEGAELYRAEARLEETKDKYGRGTPDDWMERNVYSRFTWQGVGLMLIIDLALFGAAGLTIWAVQMAWIPVTAAGIINGLGHWWGYRNFEAADGSTNLTPWGLLIGGEELHNNHHTYPTSAKFSVKPYEFDLAWGYIRALEMVGLAKVRKTPPIMKTGEVKSVADSKTVEAIITHRYEVMAGYARNLRRACAEEMKRLKSEGAASASSLKNMQLARRWLHRDDDKIPAHVKAQVNSAMTATPALQKLVAMREELRQVWTSSNASAEQALADLQAWCQKAESSGISALQEFSQKLRAVRA